MPLWHVYHPPGVYSAGQKERLAQDVTEYYSNTVGLPKFYVMTLFHEIETSSFFVGGRSADSSVRIVIEHIARHAGDDASRKLMRENLCRLVAPHTTDRGLYCEFHIDETPQDLWMIDGISPPAPRSETEKLWARENRPTPF